MWRTSHFYISANITFEILYCNIFNHRGYNANILSAMLLSTQFFSTLFLQNFDSRTQEKGYQIEDDQRAVRGRKRWYAKSNIGGLLFRWRWSSKPEAQPYLWSVERISSTEKICLSWKQTYIINPQW